MSSDGPTPVPARPLSFDPACALDLVEGDWTLLAELVAVCNQETPRLVEEIRDRLAAGDAVGLGRAAHRLRGTVSSLGRGSAWESAGALDGCARRGDLEAARAQLVLLERELAFLEQDLVAFLASEAAA